MIVQDPNRRSPELEDIARDGGDRRRRRGNPSSAASSTPFFFIWMILIPTCLCFLIGRALMLRLNREPLI
jgi:hypothetical protein